MGCTCDRSGCSGCMVHGIRNINPPPVTQQARITAVHELEKAIEQRINEKYRLACEIEDLEAALRLLRETV